MDGASKFVKGDAIAGILILVINIVGGNVLEFPRKVYFLTRQRKHYIYYQLEMGWLHKSLLLLLAISTAIIVTRVSSNHDMASHIGKQISISRAWIPVYWGLVIDRHSSWHAYWTISHCCYGGRSCRLCC